MSVHSDWPRGMVADEDTPCDARDLYGFTKGLGERICQYFAANFSMRLIALRITGPRTREAFIAELGSPPRFKFAVHAPPGSRQSATESFLDPNEPKARMNAAVS